MTDSEGKMEQPENEGRRDCAEQEQNKASTRRNMGDRGHDPSLSNERPSELGYWKKKYPEICHCLDHGIHLPSAPVLEAEIAALRRELEETKRERDELRNKIVCCYCGEIREKPQPFTKDGMLDEILVHLKKCPTHPANAYIEAMDKLTAAESELARLREALEKIAGYKATSDSPFYAIKTVRAIKDIAFNVLTWGLPHQENQRNEH